ncbi:TauD/TfdA family dioxygenase [Psychromonas sp. 14N.309.X.WAT.B.A12]|uniref:TauD/TfdA family dioxygenase n=1 Tax=unclassified Psychromonas TaxID=2614957 RepID=UPI0025AFCB3E|nr:TauD/TfdA family dioxygenase [Psychromonas sp. 14N.309.X.WAT.B.A12]MDN2661969.1 TauD/TfdA family dioxygenase [Psychromonas sp. 14N.309.X.WAT.B.A12]
MITFSALNLNKYTINELTEIKSTFYQQGFVLIDTHSINAKDKISPVANALNLGEAATTAYNKKYFDYKLTADNMAVIGDLPNRKGKINHEGFESNNAQGLHVDGTIEPLGSIQTSLLYCKQPAKFGGESIVFNLIGAINHLAKNDLSLIQPLFDPNALTRASTYEGINESHTGPILGYHLETKRLIARFAINITCQWQEGFDKVPGLQRTIKHLFEMAKEDSPYTAKFPLQSGTLMVMDNSRICHGRAAYIDCTENPRTMIRGIYSQLPS